MEDLASTLAASTRVAVLLGTVVIAVRQVGHPAPRILLTALKKHYNIVLGTQSCFAHV